MEGKGIFYTIVIVLIIVQVVSFITLSVQYNSLYKEIEDTEDEINDRFLNLLNEYSVINQQNLREITKVLSQQETSFQEQITLLKSSEGDFSGVIEDAVKSVVSVSTEISIGSGFFVDSDGYIVTNQHVIGNSSEINILTYDNRFFSASVLGIDVSKDLALLKVSGNYEMLDLGDSDDLQVGNKVIAIGNPLGLSFSVTEGIISGLGRNGPSGINEYIQTDVSLNPGNSGGPLIDVSGNAIGINNFKLDDSYRLGFALESNSIKDFVNGIVGGLI